jgi:hypothetical protein
MSAPVEEQAEAAAATVLEALREPGFRSVCADRLLAEADGGGFLFIEVPLAALCTVARLLPLTVDRAVEQRFKPLLARARSVATCDAHAVRSKGGLACHAHLPSPGARLRGREPCS